MILRGWNLINLKKKKSIFDQSNCWIVQYTKDINIPLHMRQSVAFGTLLNSCSYNTCLEPKFFYLILQLGGTYAIMGRESVNSTLLHKLTCCVWDTHMTTSILSWIKFYKTSIKSWNFFSDCCLSVHYC